MNTSGTFGVGSAAYYWARALALMIRLSHVLPGLRYALFHLIYVDDGKMTAGGSEFADSILRAFLVLAVLGVPFAWGKVRGGLEV